MTTDTTRRGFVAALGALLLAGPAAARGRRSRSGHGGGRSRARSGRESASSGAGGFSSCADARAAGVAPLRAGRPGYSHRLDRDGDGVACE